MGMPWQWCAQTDSRWFSRIDSWHNRGPPNEIHRPPDAIDKIDKRIIETSIVSNARMQATPLLSDWGLAWLDDLRLLKPFLSFFCDLKIRRPGGVFFCQNLLKMEYSIFEQEAVWLSLFVFFVCFDRLFLILSRSLCRPLIL
jgi:hypothetical protein